MTAQDTFRVALCGLSGNERKALGSIFKLAASRPRAYVICDDSEKHNSHVFVVDTDDEVAVNEWRNLTSANVQAPSLRVGSIQPHHQEDAWIKRPLILLNLLKALDKLVISAYQYAPELVIADDQDINSKTHVALQSAAEANSQTNIQGYRALVVDDSDSVRQLMKIELRLCGISADFAASGEEAIALFRRQSYDLVFLDIMLPGIDGYQVCKRCKTVDKSTKVVFLTGRGSSIDKLRGVLAGCSGYLTKPVAQDKLHAIIRKHLQAKPVASQTPASSGRPFPTFPTLTFKRETY